MEQIITNRFNLCSCSQMVISTFCKHLSPTPWSASGAVAAVFLEASAWVLCLFVGKLDATVFNLAGIEECDFDFIS